MITKWRVSTAPELEPVTLTQMKLHLRVDCDTDDDLITALIIASREWCEDFERRAYITQTITAKLDYLPDVLLLPKPRLQSVTSIKYYDLSGVEQTLSSDLYDVDIYREPGQVVRGYNDSYPSMRSIVNAVEIIYKAGYGDAAASVPDKTIAAIKLFAAHLYENRIAAADIRLVEMPLGVKSLLNARANTA